MEFVTLNEKEYTQFWENHPLKAFLSAPEIGHLREKSGWRLEFVGVKENNEVIAATMLLSIKRRIGGYEYYSPRGFLLDYKNKELLHFFVKEIKQYIKNNGGYTLRIDPYLIYKQRDIDAEIVDGGEDNSDVVDDLLSLGFKKHDMEHTEQAQWMFSLGLENKDEATLLKEMNQHTRRVIRKTLNSGIKIRELKYEELDEFRDMMNATGERKSFSVRDLSYYQDMYNLLYDKDEICYLVSELDLDNYIETLNKDKDSKQKQLDKVLSKEHTDKKVETIQKEIDSFDKKIKEANDIKQRTGKSKIMMSGAMFINIQPEVIYLAGGNYREYLNFSSQYLIQWTMIQYGLEHHFKKYNFYGIKGNFKDNPENAGVYQFKRGFNGFVEELIGEYELPISSGYYLNKLISLIRR